MRANMTNKRIVGLGAMWCDVYKCSVLDLN